MMGWTSLLLAMVAMALALPACATLSALAMLAVQGNPRAGPGGPLLPCGTSGDQIQDQRQVVDAFGFPARNALLLPYYNKF